VLPRAPKGSTARRGLRAQRPALGAHALALALVCCVAAWLGGCAKQRLVWVSQPAAGRPASCPDDAVDPTGDRNSPIAARCSYADTPGADTLLVQGKVVREVPGSLAEGVADVEVSLHRAGESDDGSLGPALARARTDPQGNFGLRVRAAAGHYVVVALGSATQPFALAGGRAAPPRVVVLVPDPTGGHPR
jgi:hypothetical protein